MVLTRRMFRPDPDCWVTSFSELVEYLSDRVRRSGERVDWVRDAAVQGCASPLAALLSIVEKLPSPETADLDKHRNVEGESLFRLQGAVEIGRHVSIGPGAIIIGPAALGDGSNIGAHAVVSRSVVLPGECVPAHAHCHHRVIGRPENSAAEHLEREVPDHEMRHPSAAGPGRAHETLKRLSDAVLALLTLVTLSPLLLLIAVVIKSTSRGPVLFRHRRQGKGGTEFDCLKFRTMGAGADAQQHELRMANQVDGPQFKLLNDPRVTRVGRVLRRTNLDELPQFLNVLLGQMSLVGPRPSPDNENQCCPPWRKARLSVRPGITGLWQVTRSDDRHQTDFQEWIYYDTCYVERRCLWLDLQIIWQTVRILLRCGTSRRWRRRWMPGAADHEVVAPYVRPAFSRSSQ